MISCSYLRLRIKDLEKRQKSYYSEKIHNCLQAKKFIAYIEDKEKGYIILGKQEVRTLVGLLIASTVFTLLR